MKNLRLRKHGLVKAEQVTSTDKNKMKSNKDPGHVSAWQKTC